MPGQKAMEGLFPVCIEVDAEVFNPKNRLTKIKAILPLSILLNFELNDRFKIVDRLFRINKITTNLTTGESDIELLNEL